MGLLDKLFGKKPASPLSNVAGISVYAVSEAPEFPDAPIVLRRDVSAADAERALSQAGFVRGEGDRWSRDGAVVERRTEANGNLHVLVFSGEAIREAQRALLPTIAWVDPNAGLYDQLRDNRIAAPDLCYLLWATRHYRCVGGVPAELRRHADPEVTETIRLIDRAQMADAARARRNR